MTHLLEGLALNESREITWPVTQEDIDHGNRGDCWTCPIARSLCRLFPEFVGEADHNELSVADKDTAMPVYAASTPESAAEFMWAFDDDGTDADGRPDFTGEEIEAIVQPFSITATFTRVA